MRPVNRGPWPTDAQTPPQPLDFTDYGEAQRWLYERIGTYCSYCNRRLESGAVEHVRPKKPGGVLHPSRQRDANASDLRYERRRKIWQMALDARQDLLTSHTPRDRASVLTLAQEAGYWPIWYHHLHDIPHMRDLLISRTPGTADVCFAPDGTLLPRPGGQL